MVKKSGQYYNIAHSLSGLLLLYMRDYDKAIKAGEKGLSLNPSGSYAHLYLAMIYWCTGKSSEAVQLMNQAFRLNPIPLPVYYPLSAMAHRFVNNFHRAVEMARKGIELQPNMLFSYLVLAASYVELDMIEDAKNAANEAMRIDPHFSVVYYAKTLPYKNQEDIDRYINALRKAGLPD